jgi:two-component system sensor histidine kinase UhpB
MNGTRTPASEAIRDREARTPPATRLLGRLPLFWKIVLANATVVAVGVATGALMVSAMDATEGSVPRAAAVVGVCILALSVVVNLVLMRVALAPIQELQRTAEDVLDGDFSARGRNSSLSDRRIDRLVSAFNEMLDCLSLHRRRQRELARRVLEAEERERERIAHELFSGTAQTLAAVLVRLRVAQRQLENGDAGSLAEIRQGVVDALEEIRRTARRLRPPELDELGVRAALEAHARSMTEGTRIEVVFDGALPPMDRESSLALFRIVQEAVNNAVIHGDPDSVHIVFRVEDETLIAEVRDDGVGFDLEDSLLHTSESLGIFGMHERAGYVQGELSLESGVGRGTVVRVTIPLGFEARRRADRLNGTAARLMEGLLEELPAEADGPDWDRSPRPVTV